MSTSNPSDGPEANSMRDQPTVRPSWRKVRADLIETTPDRNGAFFWMLAAPLIVFAGWLWVDLFAYVSPIPWYWLDVILALVVYLFVIIFPLGVASHALVTSLPRLFQHAGWDVQPLEPVKPEEQYLVRYTYQARRRALNSWSRWWLRAAQGWVYLEIAVILVGGVLMIPLFLSASEFGFGR
jgi:hypothetical protein